jgi:hypothetical protein
MGGKVAKEVREGNGESGSDEAHTRCIRNTLGTH